MLCSHAPPSTPLEDLLPPLTASAEIDLQVWALLALVVRDFVASWYGTITNDTELVREVVRIVGVVVGGVATRLGKVSFECGGWTWVYMGGVCAGHGLTAVWSPD